MDKLQDNLEEGLDRILKELQDMRSNQHASSSSAGIHGPPQAIWESHRSGARRQTDSFRNFRGVIPNSTANRTSKEASFVSFGNAIADGIEEFNKKHKITSQRYQPWMSVPVPFRVTQ